MKLSAAEFGNCENKAVTLLGMSGVGKTTISSILKEAGWFHFSTDYRIGTAYLNDAIIEDVARRASEIPQVRELIDSRSISVQNNLTIENLQPLSAYLGKIGNPEQDGFDLPEFKKRQALHKEAEIAATLDVPAFIQKAHEKYGCAHFVNDSSGSLCELDDDAVLKALSEHTLLLYIEASEDYEQELIERAVKYPKPLYYPQDFFDQAVADYMAEKSLEYVALIDPDDFVRWVFPALFRSRIPKYQKIAKEYGYTVAADDVQQIKTETDFIDLVCEAIERKGA